MVSFPIFVAIQYNTPKNFNSIIDKNKDFLARFGAITSGLNFKRRGRLVILYTTMSIIRKLWLALIVVGLQH
jgi:hypothetical protein